jgi:transposase-like protein
MSKEEPRVFSRAFKIAAVNRMLSGENVTALARQLGVRRNLLYNWRKAMRRSGVAGLRNAGRPRAGVALPEIDVTAEGPAAELAAARQRVVELERKVGQQQLELDFFRKALQQVGAPPGPQTAAGAPASTPSSKR